MNSKSVISMDGVLEGLSRNLPKDVQTGAEIQTDAIPINIVAASTKVDTKIIALFMQVERKILQELHTGIFSCVSSQVVFILNYFLHII